MSVPALLRGGGAPSHPVSSTASPLQQWDSAITTLVRSSIIPQCSTLGGDLYILTGVGGLGGAEDGDEECETTPLWSAVCCSVPEGKSGFSVGLIREAGEGERQVSVKELEEKLGVAELFLEGCGGADGGTVGITAGLHSEGPLENTEKLNADLTGENTGANDVDSNAAGRGSEGEDSNEDIKDGREPLIAGEEVVGVGAQPEETGVVDATQETSADGTTSESSSEQQRDMTHSKADRSESPESSTAEYEAVDEQEADTNSSSTVVFLLSTTLSILKAPLQPVVSTVTQLPGQVIQAIHILLRNTFISLKGALLPLNITFT